MEEIELAAEIADLLGQQAQCVLATMDETGPCQHVMAYAYSEDLFTIYLATYMDTRKFRNMLSNPKVSMIWDNCQGGIQDHVDGYSLTATGTAELLEGKAQDKPRAAILARNSTLAKLLSQENCRLFSVVLDGYTLTIGYDHVFRFERSSLTTR
jgi:nitroimidazol reductase NimA-like FMN-containing flavoprotein (pyridoxamine 5'-phosphate oxidase superfamily)